jgi:hypothetical protein
MKKHPFSSGMSQPATSFVRSPAPPPRNVSGLVPTNGWGERTRLGYGGGMSPEIGQDVIHNIINTRSLGKTRINMNQPFPSTCWNSTASFSVLLVNPLVRCWCLLAASSLLMQPTILVSLVDSQMVLSITLLLKSKCLAVDSQIHYFPEIHTFNIYRQNPQFDSTWLATSDMFTGSISFFDIFSQFNHCNPNFLLLQSQLLVN